MKLFQLTMNRIFTCDRFFIGKCIGDYVLDFVLANELLAECQVIDIIKTIQLLE